MLCEFHIPISATADFFRRVHYLAASIERNSGLRPGDYKVVVTMGDRGELDPARECRWAREYPIEFRWADETRHGGLRYAAQWCERYQGPFEAETVALLDGDVLVTGSLIEAIREAAGTNRFMATRGHFSPFYLHPEHLAECSPHTWWRRLFDKAGLPMPPFDMEHQGWELMRAQDPPYVDELRFSPPYPNAGVIFASAQAMAAIGTTIVDDLARVNTLTSTMLSGQVALTLSIVRHRLQWTALPLTYNFINLAEQFDADPVRAADIRVLHYMLRGQVDREQDFMTEARVQAMLARPGLAPVNQWFVDRLAELHTTRVWPAVQATTRL